jgi:hypothetical protein
MQAITNNTHTHTHKQQQVKNGVTVELTGPDHEEKLIDALLRAGYTVEIANGDDHAQVAPGFAGYREKAD